MTEQKTEAQTIIDEIKSHHDAARELMSKSYAAPSILVNDMRRLDQGQAKLHLELARELRETLALEVKLEEHEADPLAGAGGASPRRPKRPSAGSGKAKAKKS